MPCSPVRPTTEELAMEVANTVRKAVPDDLPQISSALSRAFPNDPLR
jgi:hypothetical protein